MTVSTKTSGVVCATDPDSDLDGAVVAFNVAGAVSMETKRDSLVRRDSFVDVSIRSRLGGKEEEEGAGEEEREEEGGEEGEDEGEANFVAGLKEKADDNAKAPLRLKRRQLRQLRRQRRQETTTQNLDEVVTIAGGGGGGGGGRGERGREEEIFDLSSVNRLIDSLTSSDSSTESGCTIVSSSTELGLAATPISQDESSSEPRPLEEEIPNSSFEHTDNIAELTLPRQMSLPNRPPQPNQQSLTAQQFLASHHSSLTQPFHPTQDSCLRQKMTSFLSPKISRETAIVPTTPATTTSTHHRIKLETQSREGQSSFAHHINGFNGHHPLECSDSPIPSIDCGNFSPLNSDLPPSLAPPSSVQSMKPTSRDRQTSTLQIVLQSGSPRMPSSATTLRRFAPRHMDESSTMLSTISSPNGSSTLSKTLDDGQPSSKLPSFCQFVTNTQDSRQANRPPSSEISSEASRRNASSTEGRLSTRNLCSRKGAPTLPRSASDRSADSSRSFRSSARSTESPNRSSSAPRTSCGHSKPRNSDAQVGETNLVHPLRQRSFRKRKTASDARKSEAETDSAFDDDDVDEEKDDGHVSEASFPKTHLVPHVIAMTGPSAAAWARLSGKRAHPKYHTVSSPSSSSAAPPTGDFAMWAAHARTRRRRPLSTIVFVPPQSGSVSDSGVGGSSSIDGCRGVGGSSVGSLRVGDYDNVRIAAKRGDNFVLNAVNATCGKSSTSPGIKYGSLRSGKSAGESGWAGRSRECVAAKRKGVKNEVNRDGDRRGREFGGETNGVWRMGARETSIVDDDSDSETDPKRLTSAPPPPPHLNLVSAVSQDLIRRALSPSAIPRPTEVSPERPVVRPAESAAKLNDGVDRPLSMQLGMSTTVPVNLLRWREPMGGGGGGGGRGGCGEERRRRRRRAVQILLSGLLTSLGLSILLLSSASLSLVPSLPLHNAPFWSGGVVLITGVVAAIVCALETASNLDGAPLGFYAKVALFFLAFASTFVAAVGATFPAIHANTVSGYDLCWREDKDCLCGVYARVDGSEPTKPTLTRSYTYRRMMESCTVIRTNLLSFLVLLSAFDVVAAVVCFGFAALLWRHAYGYSNVE